MGISTQTIAVDLSKQLTRPQVVRLGQGDRRGTTLVADIYDNGVAYNLDGKTARFSMRAPDGASSYSVAASSYSGNKATFSIDETYAASIAGKTDTAYVEILSGSTVICSTSRITVIVLRSASQGLPVSGAYSDALEEAIAAANAAIEAMGDISELAVPEMSASVRGGAKLGTGLAVVDGTLGVDLSNVNTGVLPVAHGGTGVTTAAAERERLGLGSTTGALPIANGGTGATTAHGARTNLGAASATDVAALQDAVGTVDVATDGDLQSQVDTLRDSVTPTTKQTLAAGCTYQKVGKLVVMKLDNYQVSGTRTEIGFLPNGYRPADYCVAPAYGTTANGYLDANTNGRVTVQANGNAFATLVFFVP